MDRPRLSDEEIRAVFELIETTISGWINEFRRIESSELPGLALSQWQLGGSLATGTFLCPKPRKFSHNERKIPPQFDWIVEADVRLLLPECLHPHDDTLLGFLSELLRAQGISNKLTIPRWDVSVPTIGIYTYLPYGERIGIELEVSLYERAPYFEIASVWRDLFTDDEILWQTFIREYFRGLPNGEELLTEEKDRQVREARWRFISLLALGRVMEEKKQVQAGIRELILKMEALPLPGSISQLVERWIGGDTASVSGLQRPDWKTPSISIDHHTAEMWDLPEEPSWIRIARSTQMSRVSARDRLN